MNLFSKLKYLLYGGTNGKTVYSAINHAGSIIPDWFFRIRLRHELGRYDNNSDEKEYIQRRVNYYNKMTVLDNGDDFFRKSVDIGMLSMTRQKAYRFGIKKHTRWFPPYLRLILTEDHTKPMPDVPCIMKSRPIHGHNANSVLLDIDKTHHFLFFIKDRLHFEEKKDMAIFRGKILNNLRRSVISTRNLPGNTKCACHTTDSATGRTKHGMSVCDQLKYRYIVIPEDNETAYNLKWIMSSNSIAVMPRPTTETWFMEGTLIPNYHYIEVKDDLSDIEEKLNYYSSHPDEAERIIKHANDYIGQFRNRRRERIISLLVLDRYFSITNSYKNITNYERHERTGR